MRHASLPLRVRHALTLLAFATPAVAQLLPNTPWVQVGIGLNNARRGAAMAYDAQRDAVVMFGGYNGTATVANTQRWNGAAWSVVSGAQPPARWNHGMVYDRARGRVVLFGGFAATSGSPEASTLGDTWEWDGTQWLQRAPATAPSPRGAHGMVFDTVRNRTVLFGGANGTTGALNNEVWEWDGVDWTQRAVAGGPSARRNAALAYDWARNQVVLFGGRNLAGALADTWTLAVTSQSAAWTQKAPATSPPARSEASMVFDPLCGVAVLGLGLGAGAAAPTTLADWWAWDGVTWQPFSGTAGAISARSGAAVAYDFHRGRSVLFGGASLSGAHFGTTYARDGGCARAVSATVPPAVGVTARFRYAYPAYGASNIGLWLVTAPSPAVLFLPFGEFFVHSELRVDIAAQLASSAFFLDGAGIANLDVAVPAQPNLAGLAFDVQALDLNFTHGFLHWAGNDVAATVQPFAPNPALGLVAIAPGTFQMGSNAGNPDEQPVHAVTLTRPFWMARHEVTQAQYQSVMGANPSFFQGVLAPNAAQRPVETVSWNEALAFCAALTASEQAAGRVPTGYQFRLPTEAEWEYCCRAGTTTEWHTGASLTTAQANFGSALANASYSVGQTAPVGSYAPNPWGLYDMAGNVAEMCLDFFGPYAPGAVTDPFVASAPAGTYRIQRGGTFYFPDFGCRSAWRGGVPQDSGFQFSGFRMVLAPILVP